MTIIKSLTYYLTLIVTLFSLPQISYADLSDYNIATWNLQGSSAANESKWNINIRQLLSGDDAADILMVQEAGSLPTSARSTGRVVQPPEVGIPIEEYTWNIGTTSRPNTFYIYYSRLDVGANRVNLAIVSRSRAEDVYVIRSGTTVLTARPAIGIRIGNDAFLSAHALSPRGTDAVSLIQNVYSFFNSDPQRNHISWILAGDFNRSPTNLQAALQPEQTVDRATLIIAPTEATHRSGNILDYAISHNATISPGQPQRTDLTASLMFNRVRSQITSDHFPISITKKR